MLHMRWAACPSAVPWHHMWGMSTCSVWLGPEAAQRAKRSCEGRVTHLDLLKVAVGPGRGRHGGLRRLPDEVCGALTVAARRGVQAARLLPADHAVLPTGDDLVGDQLHTQILVNLSDMTAPGKPVLQQASMYKLCAALSAMAVAMADAHSFRLQVVIYADREDCAHHIGVLDVGGHHCLSEALDLAVDVCRVLNDLHSHHSTLPSPCAGAATLLPEFMYSIGPSCLQEGLATQAAGGVDPKQLSLQYKDLPLARGNDRLCVVAMMPES